MKCRVCGSANLKYYYSMGSEGQFKYYKCNNCGLVNVDLENVKLLENQEKYSLIYPDPKSPQTNIGSYESYKFIKKHLPEKGYYLDIGCGNGSLLYFAREIGWEVKGFELSQFLANKIRETLDIEVKVGNFLTEELEVEQQQYDLVSLRHVLEHLEDSVQAMNQINKLLKPGAYALLEFPNIEAVSFKVKRFLEKNNIKKKKYRKDWVPGHCNEFSLEPWQYLLNETGFKLLKWETYSLKPLNNSFYKFFNIGNKVRTLIQKI